MSENRATTGTPAARICARQALISGWAKLTTARASHCTASCSICATMAPGVRSLM
jgi:hypothetical protein